MKATIQRQAVVFNIFFIVENYKSAIALTKPTVTYDEIKAKALLRPQTN